MGTDAGLTILVNSCDKYEDAWYPFFKLLKIQWPECENYRIALNTETKKFDCDFLNVETICGGNTTWSKRIKKCLQQIDTEFVLCFLEDFFLQSPVDHTMFLEALDRIASDGQIGYIGLNYVPERKFKGGIVVPKDRFFSRDLLETNIRLAFMSALWRREWLLDLLRPHETPWEFERYGSVRSVRTIYSVLHINNHCDICPPVFDYTDRIDSGLGITRGQWLPKNKELFQKYGIEVNFDRLGINYALYENACNPQIQIGEVKRKSPTREFLYTIKKGLQNARRKTITTIRKIRSLI